jgi:hypothetical protein
MLSTIMSLFGGQIIEKMFGTITDIISKWQQKQISDIEAKQAIVLALVNAVKDIEVTYAQELTKTYTVFMGVVERNNLVATVWAITSISQLIVLLWHQVGIPWLVYAYRMWWGVPDFKYPSSGTTVDWAYALLGGLLGLGALALKNTAGAGTLTDRIKGLVGK